MYTDRTEQAKKLALFGLAGVSLIDVVEQLLTFRPSPTFAVSFSLEPSSRPAGIGGSASSLFWQFQDQFLLGS